jgi:tetratricopeptide (TPR) repeat protein
MQYQDLLNSARAKYLIRGGFVANPYVEFPITCPTSKEVKEMWDESEKFYSRLKWKESLLGYEACVTNDSLFCDAYLRLAQCQVHLSKLDEAWNTLKLAERKFPRNAMVYLGLGQLSIILNFPNDAIGYFEKMGELQPNNLEYYLGASFAFYQINHYGDALHFLERGRNTIQSNRTSTPLITYNGRVAGPIFENSNRNRWEYLTIYEAVLNYKLHQNASALKLLRSVSNQNHDQDLEGTRQYFMGLCFLSKGENYVNKAHQHLHKAMEAGIQVDPNLADSIGFSFNPGNLSSLVLRENYPYRRDDQQSVKVLRLMQGMAEEEFENRYYPQALNRLLDITEEDPTSARSFLLLAETQLRMNRKEDCLATLEKAHGLFPENEIVGLRLAREYVRVRNNNSALTCYLDLISHHPKIESAYLGAAIALANQGQLRRGLDILIGYERGQRTTNQITLLKGILFHQLGLNSVALQYVSQVQKSKNDAVASYYAAMCFHELGNKYHDIATDNLNMAMAFGAKVDEQTMLKLGLDPAVHPSSTVIQNP